MTEDRPGTVTICSGQGLFLRADDTGLLLRDFYFGRRSRMRIAWSEISHFADGRYTKEGNTSWMLLVVLRTGKQVRVLSSLFGPPGEVIARLWEVVQPHGIPAELSGVATKDDRPASRGLYADPFGQPGLRYWDGRRWSPLVPQEIKPSWERVIHRGPSSWSELPTATGRWGYAATRAKLAFGVSAAAAILSASLLALPTLSHMSIGGWLSLGFFAALIALGAAANFNVGRHYLKLDKAANTPAVRCRAKASASLIRRDETSGQLVTEDPGP